MRNETQERRRVAIAGGGTAGHVIPGLAIMQAYRESVGADVYFIGCRGGFETDLVPARGFALELLPGAPWARQDGRGKFRSIAALARGIRHARALLRDRRTELVIGLGGYASMGAVLAARSLGIPCVIHEANIYPGLANQVLRMCADRVLLGWEESSKSFSRSFAHVTGNPVVPEILAAGEYRGGQDPLRIVVLGGSTGSRFLNYSAPALLARLRQDGLRFSVLHQCGLHDSSAVRAVYQQAGVEAEVREYLHDIASVYRQASFVITTAGGLTLAELAAVGLPSLLVPMKEAANHHQIANAKSFANLTGGIWVAQEHWDEAKLAPQLAELLRNAERLRAQSQRIRKLARPHAARDIVLLCERLLS